MEMPEGWKRQEKFLKQFRIKGKTISEETYDFLMSHDLMKEMAEALEYSNGLLRLFFTQYNEYGKPFLEDKDGKFVNSENILKKFKEWK